MFLVGGGWRWCCWYGALIIVIVARGAAGSRGVSLFILGIHDEVGQVAVARGTSMMHDTEGGHAW